MLYFVVVVVVVVVDVAAAFEGLNVPESLSFIRLYLIINTPPVLYCQCCGRK